MTEDELKSIQEKLVGRARATSIVLGVAAVITVLAMIYGIIQNIEAGTWRDMAVQKEQQAIEAKLASDRERAILLRANQDLKAHLDQCISGKK
jgi:ABC-type lipoprotein release transport system permease subunit